MKWDGIEWRGGIHQKRTLGSCPLLLLLRFSSKSGEAIYSFKNGLPCAHAHTHTHFLRTSSHVPSSPYTVDMEYSTSGGFIPETPFYAIVDTYPLFANARVLFIVISTYYIHASEIYTFPLTLPSAVVCSLLQI